MQSLATLSAYTSGISARSRGSDAANTALRAGPAATTAASSAAVWASRAHHTSKAVSGRACGSSTPVCTAASTGAASRVPTDASRTSRAATERLWEGGGGGGEAAAARARAAVRAAHDGIERV